jgi:uncharacterized membrane protein
MDENRPTGQVADADDVEKNKLWAILGYIFPILFFIPLVSDGKNSPFAKFHANQQLVFLIFNIVGFTVSAILMIIIIGIVLYIAVMIAAIVFMIMGIINASKGEMKPLPMIGKFQLIK